MPHDRPQYPDKWKDEDNFLDRNNCEASCIAVTIAAFTVLGVVVGVLATYIIMR
jgi:hypothetical protein